MILVGCTDIAGSATQAATSVGDPSGGVIRGRGHAVPAPGVVVDAVTLAAVARVVDRGARAVDAVWGSDWGAGSPGVVTVVVGDAQTILEGLGQALGGSSYRSSAVGPQVAAVTVAQWRSGGPAILLDDSVWTALSATGQAVVVTHELVHLATGAVTNDAPAWLEEGFADYVAWSGADLPVGEVAREAVLDAGRGKLSRHLPSDADFTPGSVGSPVAYGQAYLAVRLLAETYGEPVVVELVRSVDSGADVSSAMGRLTGWTLDDLTAAWRSDLEARASSLPGSPRTG